MGESRRSLLMIVGAILLVSAGSQWWAWREEQALGIKIASAARPGDIMMLASDTCDYCVAARSYMRTHAVPFQECSIERDPDCSARYRALNAPGTPVFLVRGDPQVGFKPTRMLERLSRT